MLYLLELCLTELLLSVANPRKLLNLFVRNDLLLFPQFDFLTDDHSELLRFHTLQDSFVLRKILTLQNLFISKIFSVQVCKILKIFLLHCFFKFGAVALPYKILEALQPLRQVDHLLDLPILQIHG